MKISEKRRTIVDLTIKLRTDEWDMLVDTYSLLQDLSFFLSEYEDEMDSESADFYEFAKAGYHTIGSILDFRSSDREE